MNKSALILCGTLLTCNVYAATYTTTEITNNTYPDEYAKINAQGDVLWTAWVNTTDTGWTVFKYDAASGATSQLSSGNVFYDSHRINNAGDAVWVGVASDGSDHEIFLYQAATGTTQQLTNNDLHDTAPQISDNGDVSWFEQQSGPADAFLYRYDAQNDVIHIIDFPGATRQGQHSMNARGDIAWNAEVTVAGELYNQEILLFSAATQTVANITQSAGAIDTNQYLLDNGDIVWSAYDFTTSIKRYLAADGSTTDIAGEFIDNFLVGSQGHVAWFTEPSPGQYALNLFDPDTSAASVIYQEALARTPFIDGVSGRGDVVWRTISSNWNTKHYNAETAATVNLTTTQGFGPFDVALADNGDTVWSLWDGTDYEVYSYQVDSGTTTQLSNNTVDDGISSINADGEIVWHRFYLDDSELVIAVKDAAPPPSDLTIDVVYARYNARTHEAKLKARFEYDAIPSATDVIGVRFDDATLLNVAFGEFKAAGRNCYVYKGDKTKAKINFKKGTIEVSKNRVNPQEVNARDGIAVEIRFGDAVASDLYRKKMR
ncbi:MAG TPA: hypothetical protein VIM41_01890 [Gammaproteobacteria bacterium]